MARPNYAAEVVPNRLVETQCTDIDPMIVANGNRIPLPWRRRRFLVPNANSGVLPFSIF